MRQWKITKREAALTALELCHGYLVLFSIYACVAVLSEHGEPSFLYSGLLLFPVNAGLCFAGEKAKKFWQFALAAIVLIVGSVALCGIGVRGIWMGVFGVLAAVSYFAARASKNTCWLQSPVYPWIGIDVILYALGRYFSCESVIRMAPVLAGLYFLLCNFHTNLTEVDHFLKTHASLERLPVRRLARINQGMMWIVSGLMAAAMIAAPYLGIDRLIHQAIEALKAVIRWLLLLLPTGSPEEKVEATQQVEMALGGAASGATPLLLQILYKILDIIGWLIGIGLVIACVFLIVRTLYRLYLRFNEKTEENGDKIERLLPPPATEKKKNLDRKKKEHLFWDRSTDGRIRKHYRKKVLEKLKESPNGAWTPTQTVQEMHLEAMEEENFAQIYEKARYGKEACTREEMEQMLKIR